MAYFMRYNNQSIEAPSITSLPGYVKCLMHAGVNDITIDIGDMDKTIFNALVDEIRLHFCEHSSYKYIGTYDKNKMSNPYYFNIQSEKDSAISFTERDDRLEIHRENIVRDMRKQTEDIRKAEYSI